MNLHEYFSLTGASQSEFAEAIKAKPSMVSDWKSGKRSVPASRCPSIERATKGVVRCEDLRPDVEWHVLRKAQRRQRS